ncbi:hypothetical protein CEE36_02140 [candidate division TA06 bacterium B3_TA06]|uniref:Uncharacterized protein n=1 Tax=candidate division TA06 bacterium B3_TA06 TaxID=2012487 RepID=A0A532V9S1_UNCT6|nr:MAG: hypothetical protein CEE36_02140 [candidate division TA06 bacterium B3_TA06]
MTVSLHNYKRNNAVVALHKMNVIASRRRRRGDLDLLIFSQRLKRSHAGYLKVDLEINLIVSSPLMGEDKGGGDNCRPVLIYEQPGEAVPHLYYIDTSRQTSIIYI